MTRDPFTGLPLDPPETYTKEQVQCLCCGWYFEPLDMEIIHPEKYGCEREGRCKWCPEKEEGDE